MDYSDLRLWAAIIGATVIKLFTSEFHSWWRAVVQVVTAIFSAWLATEPALNFLALDPVQYGYLMAAICALTGENLIRWAMSVSENPMKLWQQWKGGAKK